MWLKVVFTKNSMTYFALLLPLRFIHICAYGQMSLRGNNEATFLYKDVVLDTVPFGAVEFFSNHTNVAISLVFFFPPLLPKH